MRNTYEHKFMSSKVLTDHIVIKLIKLYIRKRRDRHCLCFREQGWRSDKDTCLPPMWPGFDYRTRVGLSLL